MAFLSQLQCNFYVFWGTQGCYGNQTGPGRCHKLCQDLESQCIFLAYALLSWVWNGVRLVLYSPGIRMKTQWFLEILGLEDLLSHRKKDFARFMQTALKHLLSPVLENHEKLSWGTDSSHPKARRMLSFIELTNAVSLPCLTRKPITCRSSQHRNVCHQMTWSFFLTQ